MRAMILSFTAALMLVLPAAATAASPLEGLWTNPKKSVVVRVNDRGPFGGRRITDLSRAAAEELDMIKSGEIRVRLEVLP